MIKHWLKLATGIAATCVAFSGANATLNLPVPDNATITYNGLQWAWASPLGPSSVDLSFQALLGWRLPTAAELATAPTALQFIYSGANVPLGGSDPLSGANWAYTSSTLNGPAALASPYFTGYLHGDWCNGVGSNCNFGELPWNGDGVNETLVVRLAQVAGVPEPATWAMMLLGFGAMGVSLRRRRRTQTLLQEA